MVKALRKAIDPNDQYLQDLLASIEPKIRKAFAQAMDSLKDPATLEEIIALLQQGNTGEAMAIIEKHITAFSTNTISYYSVAGTVASAALSNLLGIVIAFDQTNYRAVRIMQESRLRLISEFTETQKQTIRDILTSGISRGMNPRLQAQEIANAIGLTPRQMQAVANYRSLLEANSAESLTRALRDQRFDATVARAINGDTILTQSQIDRMVNGYAKRQLDFRAEAIARTEALRVVHQANQESIQQAIDLGELDATEIVQEWLTAHDERVRGSHVPMDGQQRPFGETFVSGDGNELAYPGDADAPAHEVINCRCVLTTRLTNKEEN